MSPCATDIDANLKTKKNGRQMRWKYCVGSVKLLKLEARISKKCLSYFIVNSPYPDLAFGSMRCSSEVSSIFLFPEVLACAGFDTKRHLDFW